ncbi:GerAB/ArcD/ProY family transporter [Alkalihalobacillus sp. AL-G]|uniref:GerAB/ArcD/ProY family transporter n=1 Tax=Alkalihalobacillus sp. AL-G TaxID=2926399 RepID=UPI002729B7ED|nr:GerAB/ArcD/ProY family transporter [Alkalihalobacillus sp. AL-G]WLD91643.1 spore germination protein [Alkalihalobacillus sp. AL-G]
MNKNRGTTTESAYVPENHMVPPTMAFFTITAMLIGIGVLGFQRYIARDAGYDGWISILVGGLIMHILLWMIYQILQESGGDIVSVHTYVAGKYLGNFLNIIFSLYFLFICVVILRTYIEVIQVWIFPRLNVWVFTFIFMLLIHYLVSGGFRIVVGVCMFSVILGLPLLLLDFFPIQLARVENLFPVINHSVPEILKGTKTATLSFLGIELLFVYYPFLKNPQSSKKWAHFGMFYTTLFYMGTAIVAFIYYSEEQLRHVIWATISLWKIVEFPFVERFEYVGIAMWVYVMIPNVCITLWAATRIIKRVFQFKQRKVLWFYFILVYIATCLIKDRETIDQLNNLTGKVGLYVLLYIPVLFLLLKIVTKVRNRR